MRASRVVASLSAVAVLGIVVGCAASPPADDQARPSESSEGADAVVLNGYYPVAEGNVWVYTMTYADPVGIVTETETMTSVKPDGDGGAEATIHREFHYENGSLTDFSDDVTYLFHADGSIEVPFQSIPNADKTQVVTVNSGTMRWPSDAEFSAGTVKTGEISVSIEAGGQTFDELVTFEVFGAGEESVTVPFGTVTARKLMQNLIVSIPSFDVEVPVNATSWLQADVGLVRTEIPDVFGGTPITVELVSFTPAS